MDGMDWMDGMDSGCGGDVGWIWSVASAGQPAPHPNPTFPQLMEVCTLES